MQSLWFHVTGFQTYLDLIFKLSMYCRSPKIQKDADCFPEFRVQSYYEQNNSKPTKLAL